MPFDANLVLADSTADWTYANLVTATYGAHAGNQSTTKNSGGFAVIDLGATDIGASVRGLAIVLILTETVSVGVGLTAIVEESTTEAFTVRHELAKFDILAASKGVIVAAEAPCTVIRRVSPTLRYLRLLASCDTSDDWKTCWCLVSPYPYKVL